MSLCFMAMMYIFRWGAIHSAVASIYNCHRPTWVRRSDVSPRAERESDSLLNRAAVFLISFTNHFPEQRQLLAIIAASAKMPLTPPPAQPPTSHSYSSCSFSSSYLPHKDSTERGKWQHHNGEPNNRQHCWNSCSTSWVWPHLADSQHSHKSFLPFFFPSPPQLYEYHMYSIAITTFNIYISPLARKAFRPLFCYIYCSYKLIYCGKNVEDCDALSIFEQSDHLQWTK